MKHLCSKASSCKVLRGAGGGVDVHKHEVEAFVVTGPEYDDVHGVGDFLVLDLLRNTKLKLEWA